MNVTIDYDERWWKPENVHRKKIHRYNIQLHIHS